MSTNDSDPADPADPAVQALHAANRALDEHPRPGVRAAVLRAAAEVAGATAPARPVATVAPRERKPVKASRWLGWSWSPSFAGFAAAGVALFAVAVVLEMRRADPHDGPVLVAQTDTAVAGGAAASPGIGPPTAPADSAPPQALPRAAAEMSRTRTDAPPAPMAAEPRSFPASPAPPLPDLAATPAASSAAPAPAPAPMIATATAPAPAPTPGPALARSMARAPLALQNAPSAAADVQQDAAAGSLATAKTLARTDAAAAYRATARTWIDRIIALRRSRQDHEADAELALFRAAHPDTAIPPAALPAATP